MNVRTTLVPLLLVACTAGAADSTMAIAVTDMRVEGIEASSGRIITDRLRSELIRTGTFTVLERSQMDDVLKEQGFQQSGCVSEECAVEVGQLLGVSHIAAGSIGQVGKVITIGVRLIDVRTGRIVQDVTRDCACSLEEVLQKVCGDIARQLAAQAGGATDDARPSRNTRGRNVRRIAFSAGGAALLAGGIIANTVMQSALDENADISAQYAAATNNATYEQLSDTYRDNWNSARTSMIVRNILYAGAGLFALGFVISIPF